MNAFLDQTKNTGDQMDYGQRKNNDIGEEVCYILICPLSLSLSPSLYLSLSPTHPPSPLLSLYPPHSLD
jgi:hypothetical protein